jgi:hypothetical protein
MHDLHDPSLPSLRTVRYVRWHGCGWGDRPEPAENSLLAFVYDIPYFGACGVFPPFRLLNQFLLTGGSSGGMSPGATWEPFELSPEEYRDLVAAVRAVPPESLRDRARYAWLPFKFDPEFEGDSASYPVRGPAKSWHRFIPPERREYHEWASAVCEKHRESRRAEMKRAGFMK